MMPTKCPNVQKKRLSKSATIAMCLIFFVLCSVFCVRKTVISKAEDYINQKYGDIISINNLAIIKVGCVRITDNAWPVFFEYNDVDFQVDILSRNDNFAEKYTKNEYIRLVLSEYTGDKIRMIDIPHVQTHQGISDPVALDNLFYLEVTFDHTVNNKEAFAYEIEEILLAMNQAGLSNCDTLEAFANIENKIMHIRIAPNDTLMVSDIIDRIVDFPSSVE